MQNEEIKKNNKKRKRLRAVKYVSSAIIKEMRDEINMAVLLYSCRIFVEHFLGIIATSDSHTYDEDMLNVTLWYLHE